MPSQPLNNLVKIGQLKEEPPSNDELTGLLRTARLKCTDSQNTALSLESRFELAYSAAHSFALAALRSHGYRSEDRYTVFQCLAHTSNLENAKIRILSDAHNKRNLAAYEGKVDISETFVNALIDVLISLRDFCKDLDPKT